MPNLDRFAEGVKDPQEAKTVCYCDLCGADIYEGDYKVTSAATDDEVYCSVGCLLNAIDMQEDEA
jgi:hypothetical protein